VSVLVRPGSDENEPRVFIQWPGAAIQGWLYSPELSADVLKKTYPELNDNQVARACRALAGLVAQKMREPSPFIAPRRNWVKDF